MFCFFFLILIPVFWRARRSDVRKYDDLISIESTIENFDAYI